MSPCLNVSSCFLARPPQVRGLAEYLLGDTLATKAPLLAYNHFVEALFVLNGCQVRLEGHF